MLQAKGLQTFVIPAGIRKGKTKFFVEEPKIHEDTEVVGKTFPPSALAHEGRSVSYI